MRKFNAFLFVCCYLLFSKVVFSATVVVGDLTFNSCEKAKYGRYICTMNGQKAYISRSDVGYVAIFKDGEKIYTAAVNKVTNDDNKVVYQTSESSIPQDLSRVNDVIYADIASSALYLASDDFAKEILETASKVVAGRDSIIKDKLKIVTDGNETYECNRGVTRKFTPSQMEVQKVNGAKMACAYFSCTGKDPSEKILMLLPRPGLTSSTPNIIKMKNGSAQFQEGGFKIYDDSPGLVAAYNKVKNDDETAGLPEADVNPDLFIPSKYDSSKSSYAYLMNLANNGFKDKGHSDMCADKGISALTSERNNIATEIQDHLTKAELVEYLKLIDGSIGSYYVDRKKAQTLGCLYQSKIVDKSVLDHFDHLKAISVIKPSAKPLTPAEVQNLFTKAKNMKDIPFGYKYDGCYARAHIMAKRFEQMGISTQKAWVKGSLFVPNTDIEWGYHVAPTVEVKEKDGKIVNYVIDPSLTDKAVPLDDWVAAMGKKTKGPIMKTTYPFPNNGLDFERTSVAISPSDVYGPMDLPGMSADDKMEISKQRLKQFSEVLASQGK